MDYVARPLGRAELRSLSGVFRDIFDIEPNVRVEPVLLLDRLHDVYHDTSYEILDDSELPENVPARCQVLPDGYMIQIKDTVYTGAAEIGVGG